MISAFYFKTVQDSRLVTSFVGIRKHEYPVLNDKDATVGVIVGDGLVVASDPMAKDLKICFNERVLSNHELNKFSVLDFAISDKYFSKLVPLEISVTENELGQFCGFVSITNNTGAIFPIKRTDNWQTTEKELFTSSEFGMIILLGVAFAISAAFGLFSLAFLTYKRWKGFTLRASYLFMILFLLFFTFIRSVYFFILPFGFQTKIQDYLLAALPTFFYFTAFTLMISSWIAITVQSVADLRKSPQRMTTVIIVVSNIVLYALFVAVIVSFDQVKESVVETCGQAQISTGGDVNNTSRSISIVYTVVISVVSIAISLLSLIFGGKLYSNLKTMSKATGGQSPIKVSFLLKYYNILI